MKNVFNQMALGIFGIFGMNKMPLVPQMPLVPRDKQFLRK
jgi:hypothetical protein